MRLEHDLPGRGIRLSLGDRAGGHHGGQHLPTARGGGFRVGARIEAAWGPRQPRQHGRLPKRKVPRAGAEIQLGARIHAPGARAQIDAVQPDLQDFRLGEMPLQPQGQHQFLHLAPHRAGIGQEQILRHLLRNGRPALPEMAGQQINAGGTRHAPGVQPPMRPEAPVLDRDRGGRQIGGHVGQAQRVADHIAVRGDQRAGLVAHHQAGAPERVQRVLRPGQIAREPDQDRTQRDCAPDRQDQRPADQPPRNAPWHRQPPALLLPWLAWPSQAMGRHGIEYIGRAEHAQC